MKLLLRRNQRSGMLGGKPTFSLEVRADISADEKADINKYKLADTVLYERDTMADPGSGLLGVVSRIAFHAKNISITVRDLVDGKKVECKDIVEMLAVENQIREAASMFGQVLRAAAQFGGEEVLEI